MRQDECREVSVASTLTVLRGSSKAQPVIIGSIKHKVGVTQPAIIDRL